MTDRPKKQSRLWMFFAQEAIHQKTRKKKKKSVHLFICSFVHLFICCSTQFSVRAKKNCLAQDAKKRRKKWKIELKTRRMSENEKQWKSDLDVEKTRDKHTTYVANTKKSQRQRKKFQVQLSFIIYKTFVIWTFTTLHSLKGFHL